MILNFIPCGGELRHLFSEGVPSILCYGNKLRTWVVIFHFGLLLIKVGARSRLREQISLSRTDKVRIETSILEANILSCLEDTRDKYKEEKWCVGEGWQTENDTRPRVILHTKVSAYDALKFLSENNLSLRLRLSLRSSRE